MRVSYPGLKKELDEVEISKVAEITDEYIKKLERDLPDDAVLVMHIKKHKKAGKRCRYSIKVKVDSPDTILKSKADDWDLARSLHKVLKQVEKELEHKFKIEGQPQEKFHPKQAQRLKEKIRRFWR